MATRRRKLETWEDNDRGVWVPVIQVIVNVGFTLNYRRFYLGKKSNGEFVEAGWDTPADKRVENASPVPRSLTDADEGANLEKLFAGEATVATEYVRFPRRVVLVKEQEVARRVHVLPYRIEMWEGLEALAERIEQLRTKLDEMLGSEQGPHLIAALGGKLLPAFTEDGY